MLTTRISPNDRVNPLASRNRSAANDTPLIAWMMPLCMESSCAGLTRASRLGWQGRAFSIGMAGTRPAMTRWAHSPLVRPALQELLRLPGPELRHVLVGLDRN